MGKTAWWQQWIYVAGGHLHQTRQAGDWVGATMMDRPEWVAVHPEIERGVRHADE